MTAVVVTQDPVTGRNQGADLWIPHPKVAAESSVANGPGALAGTIDMTSRADAGASGEIDGGSRDSLEARGRLGVPAGRRRR